MPTVQQLPPASTVNPTDELMLDQSGTSVSATVEQLFAAGAPALTLTGDVTGAGTGTIVTTIAPVTTPGTFTKVTVNAKGQVTGGGVVGAADVVGALGFSPYNSANPAGYVAASALATVATSGDYANLTGAPTLGSMASQSANAVAVTGGSISGVDLSGDPVTATGSTTARTLGARGSDWVNVLDYGADPTGVADCAPAFLAAMSAVPSGAWGKVVVPKGTYRLGSFVNEPTGRLIAMVFEDGANISGSGLGVERVESTQGAYSFWQGGGGWFGFAPTVGAPTNMAFHTDIVENTSSNSGAMRVGWARTYENYNYYGKYVSGIDIAEQNIFTWPHIYDNSSGWGHWEVINGPIWDEDSGARAHISASAEHSEFDVANNGPEAGWTFRSGQGNAVQGMSIDPWGQNGNYGGNILYAYGSVGSYDGQTGGLNQRWPSFPAVFSNGNPSAVAQNSTIVITFDVTAHATANLSNAGGVSSLSIVSGGGAYTSAPTVAFSGGGGSGAVAIPVMLGGAVVGLTITSPGSGYTSPPTVTFTGGGVASPSAVTVTLNTDDAHGDVASIAAAINAAGIPNVRAAANTWGGVVGRLVVFGIAASDLGTLTLGGTALGTLGINAGAYATPRDTMVVVFGGTGGVSVGDKLTVNNTVLTVGGAGALSDVVNTVNGSGLAGIHADTNANGQLVLTAWTPQNPGGLVLAEPSGYTTLSKLGLVAGTFWPPTPPKGFATAYGELSAPVCRTTDEIAISATDVNGNTYGPVTVTLNGGAGTGWPADVTASIQSAIGTAGWYNNGSGNMLSASPSVLVAYTRGSGGSQGVVLRNTAGGTLTLANANGTPLQTLGIAPGTYQPGGYSAGSQSVFMAAEDSIAPQGRGIFLGGVSNATDRTVWPHAPLEARGGFLHGLRTDKATFDDNNAVIVGAGQAIAFGTGSGAIALTNVGGSLEVNGTAVALSPSVPTHVSQLANDADFIAAPAIPAGAGALLGGTTTAGTAATVAVGANLTLASGTLSAAGVTSFNGRSGVVSLASADVTGALGYTPGSGTGTVSSVVAGAGLAGGTISTAGTVSLGALAAGSLMGNAGTLSAVPAAIAVGAGVTLSSAGTLSNSGVVSFNTRTGAISLASADVTGALTYTPANKAGDTFSGAVTLSAGGALSGTLTNSGTISGGTLAGTVTNAGTVSGGTISGATHSGGTLSGTVTNSGTISGGSLAGTVTNAGTISGGTLAGSITAAGTLSITGTATATTQAAGDNTTKLATTGYVYQATTNATTIASTGGSTTLTAAQYGVPVLLVTGALTSNATLVVPNSGVWMVSNRTSGAFTLTVKTSAGTGVTIDQGYSAEVIADGTNVVLATTDFNGVTLQGTVTNAGTISGGTLAGTITAAGTVNFTGTGTATTQASGDDSTKLATTAFVYQATANAATVSTTGGSSTLTAAQYGVPVILATGTLASNATFVVPNSGVWTVSNRTSGAFTLTVKTSAGTGVAIDQGYSAQVFADGTNVVLGTTDFNSVTLQGSVTNNGTVNGGTLSPAVLVAGSAGSVVTVSQSLDAGGYHPVVFRTSGTNTNVPFVFAPAGIGYIATALADGTATNGNQRGQYAVDLQQSRAANTQVASGAYAVVPGGAGNTAGGSYSFAVGQGSTATGQGSVALGQYSNDGGAYGKLVFSSNASTIGNQWGVTTLYVSSVTAATRMTSDGNAAGTANSVPIRSNHVIAGTLTVTARNVSTGDGAIWSIPVLFKNSAGTVSVTNPGTSAIAPTASDSSLSTATVTIAADNTNKALSITLTPPTSTTVSASAVFLATEM